MHCLRIAWTLRKAAAGRTFLSFLARLFSLLPSSGFHLLFFRIQQGLTLRRHNHQSSSSSTYLLPFGRITRKRGKMISSFPASSSFLFLSLYLSISHPYSTIFLFFSFQKVIDPTKTERRLGVLSKSGIRAPLLLVVDFNVLTPFQLASRPFGLLA
jgi:hypothetical protein